MGSQRIQLLNNGVLHHDSGLRLLHFTVLHENEGRNSADTKFHSELALGHNVHLGDFGGVANFCCNFVENGREHFARSTVLGPKVDHHRNGGVFGFADVVVIGEVYNRFVGPERVGISVIVAPAFPSIWRLFPL